MSNNFIDSSLSKNEKILPKEKKPRLQKFS